MSQRRTRFWHPFALFGHKTGVKGQSSSRCSGKSPKLRVSPHLLLHRMRSCSNLSLNSVGGCEILDSNLVLHTGQYLSFSFWSRLPMHVWQNRWLHCPHTGFRKTLRQMLHLNSLSTWPSNRFGSSPMAKTRSLWLHLKDRSRPTIKWQIFNFYRYFYRLGTFYYNHT